MPRLRQVLSNPIIKGLARVMGGVLYDPSEAAEVEGDITYSIANLKAGFIEHDATGGDTGTLPTAATLTDPVDGVLHRDNASIEVMVRATGGTLTLAGNTGTTIAKQEGAGLTVAAGALARVRLVRISSSAVVALLDNYDS